MKSVTTISIETSILAQFKNTVGQRNVSREIENFMKARANIPSFDQDGMAKSKQLAELNEQISKSEEERATYIARTDSLKKQRQQLEAEIEKEKKRYTYL